MKVARIFSMASGLWPVSEFSIYTYKLPKACIIAPNSQRLAHLYNFLFRTAGQPSTMALRQQTTECAA